MRPTARTISRILRAVTAGARHAIPLLAALLASAAPVSCDKASTLRSGELPEGTLISIGALKSRCTSPAGCVITRSVAVQGVVTANDHYGEFPREIVIEDATGGLRIAVDRLRLSDLFPLGSRVTVQCNGLALGLYGGRVLLGAAPDARYGVARIPYDAVDRYLHCEGAGRMPEVTPIDPDRLNDPDRIDTYVRLDGLRFTDRGNWCDLDPETQQPLTTERTAVDAAGRVVVVRTASTCRYALEPLPAGEVSLCGIVDCFNGAYSLRITARRILTP